MASNIFGAVIGGVNSPILREPSLGTPYLDGNVVRVNSSVSFASWGSCMAQMAFQMQTKACGIWGCNWETRNHGTWEYLWAHDDTGEVSQQVAMGCRKGTNSYRHQQIAVRRRQRAVHHSPDVALVVVGRHRNEGAHGADRAEEHRKSTAEEGQGGAPGAIGVEPGEDQSEDGPVIKLTCD